jgi:hypothetical protein
VSPIRFRTMFEWLQKRLRNAARKCPWSVTVTEQRIVTSDGQGTERSFLIEDIQKVVVATDDSGPWGYDLVFLLFTDGPKPQGIFPLEATGCQQFVTWLSGLPGYRDRELAKAMASTSIARFVVMERTG